jgi:hypothetical protein
MTGYILIASIIVVGIILFSGLSNIAQAIVDVAHALADGTQAANERHRNLVRVLGNAKDDDSGDVFGISRQLHALTCQLYTLAEPQRERQRTKTEKMFADIRASTNQAVANKIAADAPHDN